MNTINLNDDDDAPFATGGAATGSLDAAKGAVIGKKKKPMFPPWVILFFGALFVVTVLGMMLPKMLRKPAASVDTTEVVSYSEEDATQAQMEPTVPEQPPQPEQVAQLPQPVTAHQPVVVATAPAPAMVVQAPPVAVVPASAAVSGEQQMFVAEQQMQSRQDVIELQVRVAQLEGQVDRMLAAMAGQDPTMRRVISDRLRDQALSEHQRVVVPSSRQKVNGDFKVHAVVGTRAWLRPVNSTDTEIIVTYGDLVNGSRVRDVQTQSRRVVLENGTVIQ